MQLQFVTSSIHLCEPRTTDLSLLLLRDDDVIELRDVLREQTVIENIHTAGSHQKLGDRRVLLLRSLRTEREKARGGWCELHARALLSRPIAVDVLRHPDGLDVLCDPAASCLWQDGSKNAFIHRAFIASEALRTKWKAPTIVLREVFARSASILRDTG